MKVVFAAIPYETNLDLSRHEDPKLFISGKLMQRKGKHGGMFEDFKIPFPPEFLNEIKVGVALKITVSHFKEKSVHPKSPPASPPSRA